MAHGETKQWLTAKRLARGPEAAEEELRRWSMTAFRPAKLTGNPSAMRSEALAKRRETEVGATFMSPRHPPPSAGTIVVYALGSLAAVGAGFLIGRWWRKKHPTKTPVAGESANPYLIGAYASGSIR